MKPGARHIHSAAAPPDGRRAAARRATPASGPVRTCVGCRQTDAARNLRRAVLDGAGRLLLQAGRRPLPGRGAYLHLQEKCLIAAASRGGFDRSFRRKVILPSTQALLDLVLDTRASTSTSAGGPWGVEREEQAVASAASNEDQDNS